MTRMRIFEYFSRTPLHPQWFAFLRDRKGLKQVCADLSGLALDIGCADAKPREFLPDCVEYLGLDYFDTAVQWYGTRPDVFGDAQQLPLASEAVDHVLLMDVLEHIPEPDHCPAEIFRILKHGGTLTIQVPFMYPVHDDPLEAAALAGNIAASKTCLNWISGRNPLMFLTLALPVFIVLVNSLAWVGAALSREDDMMPYAYRMVSTKS